jgi:hypothetical protein
MIVYGGGKKGVGVLKPAPMTINNIPDDNYKIIKTHGGINGRFTVNEAKICKVHS